MRAAWVRWGVCAAAIGCTAPRPVDEAIETDEGTDTAPVVDSAPHTDDEPAPEGVWGEVVDADHLPLAHYVVLACSARTCLTGESDAAGRFAFDIEVPFELALKTQAPSGGTGPKGVGLLPCASDEAKDVAAGTIYVPRLTEGTVLGAPSSELVAMEAGDGLTLTLRTASLKPSPGTFLDQLAAARLPASTLPTYNTWPGEQVVAVFALHPFAATSTEAIGVEVALDQEDGTDVWFRTLSEIDGTASARLGGSVLDGVARTAAGEGIRRLTYLVVSVPTSSASARTASLPLSATSKRPPTASNSMP